MKFLLALDIGSSSIKGAVLNLERSSLGTVRQRPFPEPVAGLPPLHFEVEPDRVLASVAELLDELAAEAPACDGVVCCGQMGGVLLVDAQNRPLTNYLSWRDQRVLQPHPAGDGSYFDVLKRRLAPEQLRPAGNELQPGSAASLLFWLAEQRRLPAGATAVTLGDYVVARLCGATPCTEPTQALGTLDLATMSWHRPLFATLGFGEVNWPQLVEANSPVGEARLGGCRVPCFPVIGDHQAALLGTDLRAGELSINVSTGSQVSRLTTRLELGDYQTRPYFGGRFLNTITHLPAGRSLNVLVALLGEMSAAEGFSLRDPWSTIARQAAAAGENDLSVDLAFFSGPFGERGQIANVTTENLTVGHLFRAAFRNMADNYAACARRLSPGGDWSGLVLSGGLVQKVDILRTLIAARLGGPCRLCAATEETLAGLLRLAATL